MSGQTCLCEPVQRFSPDGPELTGQSLNVEAQCVPAGGDGPLETEWITEDLIARTQEVWGDYLEREVDREEAIELQDMIETALSSEDSDMLQKACGELNELLFFVEGR